MNILVQLKNINEYFEILTLNRLIGVCALVTVAQEKTHFKKVMQKTL